MPGHSNLYPMGQCGQKILIYIKIKINTKYLLKILSNSLLNKLIVKKQFCTTEKFGWTGGGMHDGLHVILKIVQINILSVSKKTYICFSLFKGRFSYFKYKIQYLLNQKRNLQFYSQLVG